MAFDYDLVILGGSLAARHAAAKAIHLGARVALVEPAAQNIHQNIELPLLRQVAFRHLRTLVEQTEKAAVLGWPQSAVDDSARWETALVWLRETTEMIAGNESVGYSLTQLAASGVDVVLGEAAFHPESRRKRRSDSSRSSNYPPVVLANGRYLRSRKYLLATAAQTVIPNIEGLSATHYRTIDSFWQNPWTMLPRHLIVLGSDPRGIELAQLFNRLGSQVTLLIRGPQLLPDEDASTIALLQAHLEAEGVQILTQTQVTQARQIGDQTWIQAGDRALPADALLLATRMAANLTGLNLKAIGIEEELNLRVNQKLQTRNPHLYACGDVLGGYALPHLAEQEADIAVNHALFGAFGRIFAGVADRISDRINYRQIPWAMFTSPTLVRIGLTESQARAVYGKEVVVVQQSLQGLSRAQVQQETIGFCKLILRHNGEILGGHSLSPQAEEWMGAVALAMQHRIKLGAIDPAAFMSSSFAEILAQLIRQWQQQRLPSWQRDLWESWFNARRS